MAEAFSELIHLKIRFWVNSWGSGNTQQGPTRTNIVNYGNAIVVNTGSEWVIDTLPGPTTENNHGKERFCWSVLPCHDTREDIWVPLPILG